MEVLDNLYIELVVRGLVIVQQFAGPCHAFLVHRLAQLGFFIQHCGGLLEASHVVCERRMLLAGSQSQLGTDPLASQLQSTLNILGLHTLDQFCQLVSADLHISVGTIAIFFHHVFQPRVLVQDRISISVNGIEQVTGVDP